MAKRLRAQRRLHKKLLNERAKRVTWFNVGDVVWGQAIPAPTTTTYTFDNTDGIITTGTGDLTMRTDGTAGNVEFTTMTNTTGDNTGWVDGDGRYWFRGV
jgi:hypothetical protein